jgi:branched-chain amino acid transport system substrate-binding protein
MPDSSRSAEELLPNTGASPLLAICESEGPNSMDLCAAVRLGLADSNSPAFVSFYDDHRSAQDAAKVAETIADAGVKYAIGHFSSKAAMAASRIYGQHEVLFLAPGSSAPSLCSAASPTTVQMFGTDDEQLDCLTEGVQSLSRSAIVLAQSRTYGAELARGLLQRLASHCNRLAIFYFERPPQTLPFRICADDIVVILGSQEFASDWLHSPLRERAPPHILLSDDCFTPALFLDPDITARCSIAFLDRCNDTIVDQDVCGLRNRAATLLGRAPGPYFETSYIATRALTAAWKNAGAEKPAAVLRDLLKGQWRSPFGLLHFSGERRLRGHRWRMIPAQAISAGLLSETSARRACVLGESDKSRVAVSEQARPETLPSYELLPH